VKIIHTNLFKTQTNKRKRKKKEKKKLVPRTDITNKRALSPTPPF